MRQDAAESEQDSEEAGESSPKKQEFETTQEELEGLAIVKSIVRDLVDPSRLFLKDTKLYCSVTLDDESYRSKPIVRFYFNNPAKMRIALFRDVRAGRELDRRAIERLDDIYLYADQIKAAVQAYESGAAEAVKSEGAAESEEAG